MKNKIFPLILVIAVLLVFSAGCKGAMEAVPMKVKVEIYRDISWGFDPIIVIGAESAYITKDELVIEGPFSFGVFQQSPTTTWIGKMFIRDCKLVVPITERVRVKIIS